jgi:hypothetical protein
MHLPRRTMLALFGLAALSAFAQAQTGTEETPEAAVRALISAMEANDADGIRSAFAPSASQAYGNGSPKTGPEFFEWLQSDIISVHGRVEDPIIVATGDEVVVTGSYRNSNGYSSAADFLFKVSDDQIVSWQMRY